MPAVSVPDAGVRRVEPGLAAAAAEAVRRDQARLGETAAVAAHLARLEEKLDAIALQLDAARLGTAAAAGASARVQAALDAQAAAAGPSRGAAGALRRSMDQPMAATGGGPADPAPSAGATPMTPAPGSALPTLDSTRLLARAALRRAVGAPPVQP